MPRTSSEQSTVPRGTPGPIPTWAAERWPGAVPALQQYAGQLSDEAVTRGLLGPREVPRLWERHLLNCAVAVDVAPSGASVIDIGSGAGLPGVVWSLVRPDLRVQLVEPALRRVVFLREVVDRLSLGDRVQVTRARAEDLRDRADVVTSRAVAPWSRLAAWSLRLLAPGGVVAALKGEAAAAELAAAAADLRRLRAGSARVVLYGADVLPEPTRVVLLRLADSPLDGANR